jgi:hypothetical protein
MPLALIGLSLAGLVFTTFYYGSIAQALRVSQAPDGADGQGLGGFLGFFGPALLKLLGLVLLFCFMLLMIWLPAMPFALLAALFSGLLAVAVLMTGFVLLAVYLAFAIHGILLNRRPLLRAVAESMRLVQRNLGSTVALFVTVYLVRAIAASLWRMADSGTWLTLLSIAGHAFISTALIVATFIFYRDRYALMAGEVRA